LRRERLQLTTHHSNLVRSHTHSTPHRAGRTRTTSTDLTKPYYACGGQHVEAGQGTDDPRLSGEAVVVEAAPELLIEFLAGQEL
ncbi:hypothetical protein, partial [Streptomyces sp. 2A115]|uniref:hypothetical protein n=1 Tax=Streptomyces sp. 2A115 TaxID=3457439 RepID=UPI003FCFB59E